MPQSLSQNDVIASVQQAASPTKRRLPLALAAATSILWLGLLPATAAGHGKPTPAPAAPVAPATPAAPVKGTPQPPGTLKIVNPDNNPQAVIFVWQGPVKAPMAQMIRDAFNQVKATKTRVVLNMNSGGGSIAEGEKVIQVLREISQTHRFVTTIGAASSCMSMCVPIYLQGKERYARATAVFMFHEARQVDPVTLVHHDRDRVTWVQGLVRKYFPEAGVSQAWIDDMLPKTNAAVYYQSAEQLWNSRSGVVTCVLSSVEIDLTPAKKGAAADAPEPGVIKDGCMAPPSAIRPQVPPPITVAVPAPPRQPVAPPAEQKPAPAVRVTTPQPPQVVPATKDLPATKEAPATAAAPPSAGPNIPANLPSIWPSAAPTQRPIEAPSPFG